MTAFGQISGTSGSWLTQYTKATDGPVGDPSVNLSVPFGDRGGRRMAMRRVLGRGLGLERANALHIGTIGHRSTFIYQALYDKARRGPRFPLGALHLKECRSHWEGPDFESAVPQRARDALHCLASCELRTLFPVWQSFFSFAHADRRNLPLITGSNYTKIAQIQHECR